MAAQDWTTYVETDPASDLAVNVAQINITTLTRTSNTWVYKDWGVGYFTGDIICLTDVRVSAMSASGAAFGVCGFSNNLNGMNADDAGLFVWVGGPATAPNITMYEKHTSAATWVNDTPYSAALSTTYYLKLVLSRSVGAKGTAVLYIYSDAARTTLINTQTIALSVVYNYRFSYALRNYDYTTGGNSISGFIYNGDITHNTGTSIAATHQAFSLTTFNPEVAYGFDIQPTHQPFTLTAHNPVVSAAKNILATHQAFTLTAYSALVVSGAIIQFSVTVRDDFGSKIVGATTVLLSATDDATGHTFDFTDNQFRLVSALPTLQLTQFDSINKKGYYTGEVQGLNWNGKITTTITYNEGLTTFQEWVESSVEYLAGVLVEFPTASENATAVVAADNAQIIDGTITSIQKERMHLAELAGNATIPAGDGSYSFLGQDDVTVRLAGTVASDVRTTTTKDGT